MARYLAKVTGADEKDLGSSFRTIVLAFEAGDCICAETVAVLLFGQARRHDNWTFPTMLEADANGLGFSSFQHRFLKLNNQKLVLLAVTVDSKPQSCWALTAWVVGAIEGSGRNSASQR
ncbi:hypothetical protein PAGU2196_30970 [Pseudomonas sp. PAGU 2196]|nr:hypothetical protein PAGU2196_30970 [Pseudomonas sp. PAGU 2196]